MFLIHSFFFHTSTEAQNFEQFVRLGIQCSWIVSIGTPHPLWL
jgi:hypothetical protein